MESMSILPKKCYFGHLYSRMSTDGTYTVCCGRVPSVGNYHKEGRFKEYWKSDKLNTLLLGLQDNLKELNETWANGHCDYCPHTVINNRLYDYFENDGELLEDFLEIPQIKDIENKVINSAPDTFNIDIINVCDQRCNFCWHWAHDMIEDEAQWGDWDEWIKEKITLEMFKSVVDDLIELGGCYEIQIGGGGEPLLHPDIYKMIRYVKKNNLYCKLITNFSRITDKQLDDLIEVEVDEILINISAGTEKTYTETRQVKSRVWNKLLYNIEYIIKNRTTTKPKIILKNILNEANIHDVGEMIDLGINLKVDVVALRRFLEDEVYQFEDKLIQDNQYKKSNNIVKNKLMKYEYKKYEDSEPFTHTFNSEITNTLLKGDVVQLFE